MSTTLDVRAPSRPPGAGSARARRGWSHPLVASLGLPALLVGAYGIVQALYLRPPSPQDGMNYFELAAAFPDVELDHQSLRVGLLAPLRLFQTAFGYSEAAYYALPLLTAAALVVATYWIGWKLFTPAVGVAAALFLLVSQPFLATASVLLPDHIAGALFTTGLAVLLTVAEREAFTRRERALLVAAGLLMAWAYLVREFVVFVFPVVPVVFRVWRLPWRRLVWLAAPAAAVFAGEVVLNGVVHGSPLARFVASGGHGGQRDYITDSRLDALVRLPRALFDAPGGDVVALAVLLVPLTLVLARRRSFLVVAAWLFAFWVPMTLGTGLLVPDFRFLIADKVRYWLPAMPAVALATAALLHVAVTAAARHWTGGGPWPRRLAGLGVVVVLGVAGVVGSAGARSRDVFRVNGADQLAELRSWLSEEGADVAVVWTDHFTARLVPLYARSTFGEMLWSGEVRSLDRDGRFVGADAIDEGAVVLYRFGYRIFPGGYHAVPKEIRGGLHDGWDTVVERPDKSLVVHRAS